MMTTELATTNGGNGHALAAPTMSITEALTLADHFARSGYFADAKQASQAVVKIIAGRELGIGPMAAMSGIHLVQGKPALSAGLIGALIARSGRYRYDVVKCDNTGAELEWFRDGIPVGRSSFTMADAKLAALDTKAIWKQYPSDLCFARALTRGARRYCPDVSMGPAYTPEELGGGMVPDTVIDPSTGEVLDAAPRQLPAPTNGHTEPNADDVALVLRKIDGIADLEALGKARQWVLSQPPAISKNGDVLAALDTARDEIIRASAQLDGDVTDAELMDIMAGGDDEDYDDSQDMTGSEAIAEGM